MKDRIHTLRKKWMVAYQAALSTREDYAPGLIDWDLALYLYSTGKDAELAAEQAKQPFLGKQGVST